MIQTIDTATLDRYDERIRNAYRHLLADTGREYGDYVSLNDLRPYVGGHRQRVDEALRRMGRGGYTGPGGTNDVHLVPEANQKTLSQAQRADAVQLGNELLHCIAIH